MLSSLCLLSTWFSDLLQNPQILLQCVLSVLLLACYESNFLVARFIYLSIYRTCTLIKHPPTPPVIIQQVPVKSASFIKNEENILLNMKQTLT